MSRVAGLVERKGRGRSVDMDPGEALVGGDSTGESLLP